MPLTLSGVQYESTDELAEKYGMSIHHIRRLARMGKKKQKGGLPGKKVGRRWWVDSKKAESILVKDDTTEQTTDGEREGTSPGTGQLDYSALDDL